MTETLNTIYNNLAPSEQQEVYDFMMFLVQKKSRMSEKKEEKDWKKILDEYTGSTGGLWADEDPLEYQKRLREDRGIG